MMLLYKLHTENRNNTDYNDETPEYPILFYLNNFVTKLDLKFEEKS